MIPRRSSRRENLPFPGPPSFLKKPQYFCDFRKAAYGKFKQQEDRQVFPVTNPAAGYRRAYAQTLFSILMTEATEHQGLAAFSSVFPSVKLPFKGISAAEVKEAYTAAAMAVRDMYENEGRAVTRTENARADVVKILNTFQSNVQLNDESNYRTNLWNKLADAFFVGENTVHRSELNLQDIHAGYEDRKSDFSICLKYRNESGQEDASVWMPLLLTEVSKYPLFSALSHKDESKLATAMSSALFRSISECAHLKDEEFIKKLHVYGLLIGAEGFEVSVMYPDFGTAQVGNGPAESFRTLSFIYRSSRNHWRFSLFGGNTPDTSSNETAAFNCGPVEIEDYQVSPAPAVVPHKPGNAEGIFDASPEHREHATTATEADMESYTEENDTDDAEVANIKRIFREIDVQRLISFSGMAINWTGVGVLERLGNAIKAEGDRIAARLNGNASNDNDGYYYPEDFSKRMPQGRKTHASSSPQRTRTIGTAPFHRQQAVPQQGGNRRQHGEFIGDDVPMRTIGRSTSSSDGKEQEPQPELKYWEDEMKTVWVDVKKRSSKYELAVYSQQQIRDSPYFPELRSSAVDDAGTLSLTLEAVLTQDLYVETYPERWKSAKWQRFTLSKMILDLMGALRTLHAAGFVHSDVSPGNVGFNMEKEVWQLFDFDRAMPIEESLQTQRSGGTHGYRSRHTIETGVFRVHDDYIALMNTCFRGFPVSAFGRDSSIMEPFYDLRSMIFGKATIEDTGLDRCYLEAFKVFCKEADQTGSVRLRNSTCAVALPIQEAILEKLK